MTITTLEYELRRIAADEIGIDARDVVDDLLAPFARNVTAINDAVCMELNMKIGNAEASACRKFGEYVALVQSTRGE